MMMAANAHRPGTAGVDRCAPLLSAGPTRGRQGGSKGRTRVQVFIAMGLGRRQLPCAPCFLELRSVP